MSASTGRQLPHAPVLHAARLIEFFVNAVYPSFYESFFYPYVSDSRIQVCFHGDYRKEKRVKMSEESARDYKWRALSGGERTVLEKTNAASPWDTILVADPFRPERIKGCRFTGKVRIGPMTKTVISAEGVEYPVGLYNSRIDSCTIDGDVSIDGAGVVSGYTIGRNVVISRVDELVGGEGIEPNELKADLINENGGRAVPFFIGMLPGDGALWAKRRENSRLLEGLRTLTESEWRNADNRSCRIEKHAVIKNSRKLRRCVIKEFAVIDGAGELDNVVVLSCRDAVTSIGTGVILKNGIVGYRNGIDAFVTARSFMTGTNVSLNNGLVVENSLIGDNANLSAGELLSALVFPFHEQHHRSSFLCAAFLGGQSNIAAGAVIGSNHNSRRNDGELYASRGFWPGLCTSLKHNSMFASFSLLAKSSYPHEICLPLPFSLVSRDTGTDGLTVMPAYWLLYNMYGLERNTRKYRKRDNRAIHREEEASALELDYLAPDTVHEMAASLRLLERWVGEAWRRRDGGLRPSDSPESIAHSVEKGRTILNDCQNSSDHCPELVVTTDTIEASSIPTLIVKWREAYNIYRETILLWAATVLMESRDVTWCVERVNRKTSLPETIDGRRWINWGGKLILDERYRGIISRLESGALASWREVHNAFDAAGASGNAVDRAEYALALIGVLFPELGWSDCVAEAIRIKKAGCERTRESREKDFNNPYRTMVYDSKAELEKVIGNSKEDEIIIRLKEETDRFVRKAELVKIEALKAEQS